MAFENFPTAEVTPPTITPPPKRDWRAVFTVALIIALLGTWGYIIWYKSKTKETVKQKDTQYAVVLSEKDTLQTMLEQAATKYDVLKSSNEKKDSIITAKDKEIAEKKARIQAILSNSHATKEELAEAKRQIASLNTDIESYKQQVETLKIEKTQLTQEKQAVTNQRDKVIKAYDSVKTVVKQKEDVIDIGSTLHASNFNIYGVNEKKNGKEKETETAKRVSKLRIYFDIDENLIAKSGEKQLYVCITGPDGKPLAVEALGSGTFNTRDGAEKTFTQMIGINYTQGKRQTVSFDWKQGTSFSTGDYKIEVYNNGFKIGEGTCHFKKGGLFS